MRYVGGWYKDIILVANTDSLFVTAYELSTVVKDTEFTDNVIGLTKDGLSEKDFESDITSKLVVLDALDFYEYAFSMLEFGGDFDKSVYVNETADFMHAIGDQWLLMLQNMVHSHLEEALNYQSMVDCFVQKAITIKCLDITTLSRLNIKVDCRGRFYWENCLDIKQ